MAKNQYVRPLLYTVSLSIIAKAFSWVKVSFALGSASIFFSLRNSIVPLIAAFGGNVGASATFAGMAIISFFTKGTMPLSYVAYSGIPTLCAGFYWNLSSRAVKTVIPLLLMIAFWAHPMGAQAWPYTLFWLIPAGIAVTRTTSIFATALAATFIAHAVGSVLWLYSTAMEPAYWYALLPIVPLERFIFAATTTACYHAYAYMISISWRGLVNRLVRASA